MSGGGWNGVEEDTVDDWGARLAAQAGDGVGWDDRVSIC
jgi:hypothetical protein